ncbi:MAG: hypothetical protein Q4D82_01495 [Neisseria sp.]|nr:hypothetical protein [Neisseria sp.]
MPVNSSNTAGLVLNVGTVGISGWLFGMPVEALILGGIAGAVAHGLGKSDNNPALAVLASVMLAGSLSPSAGYYIAQYTGLSEDFLRAPVPVIIGGGWTWAWPLVSRHLRSWIDGFLAKFTGGAK